MTNEIATIYCFPRSGGTLLNQILLCEPSNVILSEINPALSVTPPLKQAREWFNLSIEYPQEEEPNYCQVIKSILHECHQQGRSLCIRDWSGINFIPNISDQVPAPSMTLEQEIYLTQSGINSRAIVMLRRSFPVYRSLIKYIPELRNISVAEFAHSYHDFLEKTSAIPHYHLEDLTSDPNQVLKSICEQLSLNFPAGFSTKFHKQKFATGNNTLSTTPQSSSWKNLQKQPALPAEAHAEPFAALDKMAGYNL